MAHKNRKKLRISCYEVLDVLLSGLKASSVAFTSVMEAQIAIFDIKKIKFFQL